MCFFSLVVNFHHQWQLSWRHRVQGFLIILNEKNSKITFPRFVNYLAHQGVLKKKKQFVLLFRVTKHCFTCFHFWSESHSLKTNELKNADFTPFFGKLLRLFWKTVTTATNSNKTCFFLKLQKQHSKSSRLMTQKLWSWFWRVSLDLKACIHEISRKKSYSEGRFGQMKKLVNYYFF